MNKNKEKVPKIRFPGFTEPWEQRKLGEVSEKVTEKNKNNIYSETLTNSAEYGIINQRDFFDKDISNEKNLDGYYIVRPDDFVYNPRISNYAPVGPINRNNLGRSGVMSPLYYVFRTHSVDKIFLEKYFSSNNWHKFMKLNGDSGARADRFAIKDSVFREMPIPSPAIEEQTKIGEFFQGIDNLITLHQRKLNHLKDKKKGLLQKMFPKNGELIPELRFPEFTAPWEQRKFDEIFTMLQNNALSRADLNSEQGSAMNVHYGDILIKFGECLDVSKEKIPFITDDTCLTKYKESFLVNGDVIIADAAEDEAVGKCSEIVGLTTETVISGLHTIPCRANKVFANGYLGYYMNSNAYHNQLLPLIQGTKVSSISKTALKDTIVLYPKSTEEQALISQYFTKLNNLITLHQRKLDHLKEQKKALLQQMFI